MLVLLNSYTHVEALLLLPPPQPRGPLSASAGLFLPTPAHCRPCSTTPLCQLRALMHSVHTPLHLSRSSGRHCSSQRNKKEHSNAPQRAWRVQESRFLQ